MPEPALVVQDLAKTFRIPKQHVHTLKERALHPFRARDYNEFNVLRDIDFRVDRGEFFGIVGRNGSGKSTLLKLMAGIYRPDRGRIAIAGRLSPFIELGVGFNPDLTAYDNVVINGVMMGLSAREAKARFDSVLEFAELEDFIDLKLKNYSSGMHVRLAFAVMVQSSADVFLIDEVLAVGDAAFQQKCFDVFYRLRDEGKTIVLVTHDMSAVERFCHRAMFLQDGEMQLIGDPRSVARAYLSANFDHPSEQAIVADEVESQRIASLASASFLDTADKPTNSIASGEPVRIRVVVEPEYEVEHPVLTVALIDNEHTAVTGSRVELFKSGDLPVGKRLAIDIEWDVTLTDGRYELAVLLSRGSAEQARVIDTQHAAELVVHSSDQVVGLIQAPATVKVSQAVRGVQ